MAQLLLELGFEEIPARYISGIQNTLIEQLSVFLQKLSKDQEIDSVDLKVYSAARRVVFLFSNLPAALKSREIIVTGPPEKMAYEDNGQLTKAALGFAKAKGLNNQDLYILENQRGRFLAGKKQQQPGNLADILLQKATSALSKLSFEKQMRWHTGEFEFVRPLRNYGVWTDLKQKPEKFNSFWGMENKAKTRGNPQVSSVLFDLPSADTYLAKMKENFVLVSNDERSKEVRSRCEKVAKEKGLSLVLDDSLLEEISNLTEWPMPILVEFDPKYLQLPEEVLISELVEHQKFIALKDENQKLAPYFVGVADNPNAEPDVVSKGFSRVVTARFEDGVFFYKTDLENSFEEARERLKAVNWQKGLGNIFQKTERIESLSKAFYEQYGSSFPSLDMDSVLIASKYLKNDLISNMVNEFSHLQGIMGYYYSKAQNIGGTAEKSEKIAAAIRDHYQPQGPDAPLPESLEGKMLALFEKLDSLCGLFALHRKISSSKDPYGLRRASLGIIRICFDLAQDGIDLPISQLLNLSLIQLKEQVPALSDHKVLSEVAEATEEFLLKRLKVEIQNKTQVEIAEALCQGKYPFKVKDLELRAESLFNKVKSGEFLELATLFKRIDNILSKAGSDLNLNINIEGLKEQEEKQLFETFQLLREKFLISLKSQDFKAALDHLVGIKADMTCFFDNIMVMHEDSAIRQNRLALLAEIRDTFKEYADLSLLPVK